MRTFVRVRALAATHGDLAKRLAELEAKTEALAMNQETFSRNARNQFKEVFDALRELMTPPDLPKRPIVFITPHRPHVGGARIPLNQPPESVILMRKSFATC